MARSPYLPHALYNLNNVNLRNGIGRGVSTSFTFIEGTQGWVWCMRFVLDVNSNLYRFWAPVKAQGCPWWDVSGTNYGRGTGGILNFRIVTVDGSGIPKFTDGPSLVVEELGIDPETRYEESKTGQGWGGTISNGPQAWYFNGNDVDLTADTMYAACFWNTAGQPGLNFLSMNPVAAREYIYPDTTSGGGGSSGGRSRPPNAINNLDAGAVGAINNLDPRECVMWSTDGGATFPKVGRTSGEEDYPGQTEAGGDPDDGCRYPIYGIQTSSIQPKRDRPYQAYHAYKQTGTKVRYKIPSTASSGSFTQVGGYFKKGVAPGTMTVRNVTDAVEQSASAESSTVGGIWVKNLAASVSYDPSDVIEVRCSGGGSALMCSGDTVSRLAYDVGSSANVLNTGVNWSSGSASSTPDAPCLWPLPYTVWMRPPVAGSEPPFPPGDLDELEEDVLRLEAQMVVVQNDIAALKTRMTNAESRLTKLEAFEKSIRVL